MSCSLQVQRESLRSGLSQDVVTFEPARGCIGLLSKNSRLNELFLLDFLNILYK